MNSGTAVIDKVGSLCKLQKLLNQKSQVYFQEGGIKNDQQTIKLRPTFLYPWSTNNSAVSTVTWRRVSFGKLTDRATHGNRNLSMVGFFDCVQLPVCSNIGPCTGNESSSMRRVNDWWFPWNAAGRFLIWELPTVHDLQDFKLKWFSRGGCQRDHLLRPLVQLPHPQESILQAVMMWIEENLIN